MGQELSLALESEAGQDWTPAHEGETQDRELARLKRDREWADAAATVLDASSFIAGLNKQEPTVKRAKGLCLDRYAPKRKWSKNQCDGCRENTAHSLSYKCLQCIDVNFCQTCFRIGQLQGHDRKHEFVALRHVCDVCLANIVGTRFNCRECFDYDRCLLCYVQRKTTKTHQLSHKEQVVPFYTLKLTYVLRTPPPKELVGKIVKTDRISTRVLEAFFGRFVSSESIVKGYFKAAADIVTKHSDAPWNNAELFVCGHGIDVVFKSGSGRFKSMIIEENNGQVKGRVNEYR